MCERIALLIENLIFAKHTIFANHESLLGWERLTEGSE
jgi:hypothetical protein